MEIQQSPYIILSLYQPLNPQGLKLGKRTQQNLNFSHFCKFEKKTKNPWILTKRVYRVVDIHIDLHVITFTCITSYS